jgi:hypothetical protein
MREPSLSQSFRILSIFLGRRPLGDAIARLEATTEHATALEVRAAALSAGVDVQLLAAAVTVRRELGPLGDLIHAAAIMTLLPELLEDGETLVNRPSLSAGDDPGRPFDVETNLRVAEFKFDVWTGRDDHRKRELFRDFVRLASDTSGRRPELLVLGAEPRHFLEASRSKASWALARSPGTLRLFTEQFGDVSASVAAFTAGPGARVRVVDMAPILPVGSLHAGDDAKDDER